MFHADHVTPRGRLVGPDNIFARSRFAFGGYQDSRQTFTFDFRPRFGQDIAAGVSGADVEIAIHVLPVQGKPDNSFQPAALHLGLVAAAFVGKGGTLEQLAVFVVFNERDRAGGKWPGAVQTGKVEIKIFAAFAIVIIHHCNGNLFFLLSRRENHCAGSGKIIFFNQGCTILGGVLERPFFRHRLRQANRKHQPVVRFRHGGIDHFDTVVQRQHCHAGDGRLRETIGVDGGQTEVQDPG